MKKIISIILAAAMMLSLIPSVFAEGEGTPIKIVYDFEGKFVDGEKYADLTYDTCKNWEYATQYKASYTEIGKNTGVRRDADTSCIRVQGNTSKTNYWIAFKLKVDNAADCSMKIKVAVADKYAYARIDAYIFKTDTVSAVENGINNKNRLSASDLTASATAEELTFETGEQLSDGKMHFEPGEYYFVFCPVTTDDGKNISWVTLYTLTLNGTVVEPETDTIPEDEFNAVEDKTTITSYDVGAVSAVAYTVGTDAQDSSVTVEAKNNNDGTYTLNAPEYEGYNFLYWKKGLTDKKDVITYKPTGFVYAPTAGENNIVIAVYEKIGETSANKAEFYNANGQFIEATNGAFPEELPSMAGYGDATGWQCYTNGETYGLDDSVTPSGIMLFVADYEDTLDTVKVNGEDVPYGTELSFTATPENGKTFKCWTRTDEAGNTEIVDIEETYKFCAYEDCTITEVDTDKEVTLPENGRKIILDTFSVGSATALMAEFIGFKNDTVVEKGIMLGNNRIAMKSTGTQFTIIPDEAGTYKGYAIIGNATDGYTLITDGSYTK